MKIKKSVKEADEDGRNNGTVPAKLKKSKIKSSTKEDNHAGEDFADKPVKKKSEPMKEKTEAAVIENGEKKKRKRERTKKDSKEATKKTAKRLKLMNELVGPSVETVDFTSELKKFTDFELDDRLLKVVGTLGWETPTQVQESVIPLALEGKNIMARARTGSGKTAAFLLPILQKLIRYLNSSGEAEGPFALVIAPTKELATQIYNILAKLLTTLPFLQALNLSELRDDERSVWEEDRPSIVVSTPGKVIKMLGIRADFCANIRHLVLDEADLLLSFGYDKEMENFKTFLPAEYQCIFTSATLTDDMTYLKKIFMTGPVVTIKLKEGDLPGVDQLSQYQILCQNDEERFTIMVAMIKLKLIVGKTIIFLNNTDRCYKLSLVLRTFGIKTCILNSEMPANNRCHVINQFNEGLFRIILASDAHDMIAQPSEIKEEKSGTEEKKKGPKDKEAGVARGIDFHHVSNVINFDFPVSTDIYIHRVGRTARGWNRGTALSFCSPEERPLLDTVQEEINKQMGCEVLLPYEIRIKELETFLLRTREALLKCKKKVIKLARIRDIKLELARSQKLEGYFANNPREKDLLARNDHPIALRLHSTAIADVPEYMVPHTLRGMDFTNEDSKTKRMRKNRKKVMSFHQKKFNKKKNDPLHSFNI